MRWIIALFAFAIVAMQLELWFGEDMRPGLKAQQQLVAEQSATNQMLVERNAYLLAEINNLRQVGEAVEERARADLGLIEADETFFQFAVTQDSLGEE